MSFEGYTVHWFLLHTRKPRRCTCTYTVFVLLCFPIRSLDLLFCSFYSDNGKTTTNIKTFRGYATLALCLGFTQLTFVYLDNQLIRIYSYNTASKREFCSLHTHDCYSNNYMFVLIKYKQKTYQFSRLRKFGPGMRKFNLFQCEYMQQINDWPRQTRVINQKTGCTFDLHDFTTVSSMHLLWATLSGCSPVLAALFSGCRLYLVPSRPVIGG